MIHHLDATLKKLLMLKVPVDTAVVDINFDMPTAEWSKKLSRPTMNLFLHDVRENLELRTPDRFLARTGDSHSLRRGPVRVDLTYLITAWTTDVADEHELLGRVLSTLVRFPILPDDVLEESMRTQPRPLQAWIARPERTPNAWDIWGPVENRMKAALSYVITASVDPDVAEPVTLVEKTVVTVAEIDS